MKKIAWFSLVLVLTLLLSVVGTAQAGLLAPHGEGQIGLQAVVLCEELTLRQKASASSKALQTLPYGSLIIVTEETNGWAHCVLGDAEDSPSGWVNAEYIAVDPAWYQTDAKTKVFAWNDINAPKVALLDKNVTVPVLKIEGDWIVVSLRGASGWIHRTASN